MTRYLLDFYTQEARTVTDPVALEPRQVLVESKEMGGYLTALLRETAWPEEQSDGYLARFLAALRPEDSVTILATRARKNSRSMAERRQRGMAGR